MRTATLAITAFVAMISALAAPPLISYQGRLENLTPAQAGQPLSLVFRIYDGAGPAAEMVYTQTMPSVVVDATGAFNVILGPEADDGTALSQAFIGADRYLSVAVDGGEELPRQRVLSVPYALNSGGSVLSGFDDANLEDPGDVGKVVEVEAGTKLLRLATDFLTTTSLQRGIYRGAGAVQVAGAAKVFSGFALEPNSPVFLSAASPGVIENPADGEFRLFATRVGYTTTDPDTVELSFGYTQTQDIVIPEADRMPLKDPSFDEPRSVWYANSGSEPIAYGGNSQCDGGGYISYGDQYNIVYQYVQLPAYLGPAIDNHAIRIRYGASLWDPGVPNASSIQIRLEFYSEENAPVPGNQVSGDIDNESFFPSVPTPNCAPLTETTCVPPDTRYVRLAFIAARDTDVDNAILELLAVTEGSQCP